MSATDKQFFDSRQETKDANKAIAKLEKAGDRMEKAIGLYFEKERIDPMNDARIAWHKLRAERESS